MGDRPDWPARVTAISQALGVILIPIVLAYLAHEYSSAQQEREIQAQYVQLAIEILSSPPSQEALDLRAWAAEILTTYSPIAVPADLQATLLRQRLDLNRMHEEAMESIRQIRP